MGGGRMTNEEAIKIIKAECYVFNPLNLDRTQMVNTALDRACKALEHMEQYKADLQSAYDCGYNCGYSDAMTDIAESEVQK
jgi:UTP-glucose-1-phosphate uridylyltransferase